jgi:uncharacterized protein (TIGR02145 family)
MLLSPKCFCQSSSNIIGTAPTPTTLYVTSDITPKCSGTKVNYSLTYKGDLKLTTFQWRVNKVNVDDGTKPTFVYYPNNNDVISCVANSNIISNDLVVSVTNSVPLTLSINVPTNVIRGTTVTATAITTNGGSSPIYQWKLNGVVVGTNSTYTFTPSATSSLSCTVTSNQNCVVNSHITSTVNINVTAPTLSVSIAASRNPFCFGTQVTLTATVTGGNGGEQYQWKVNGTNIVGATSSTYTYLPTNNTTVTCAVTSNNVTVTSNSILMAIAPIYNISGIIQSTAVDVLPNTPVTFTATIYNGGTNPYFQWVINEVNITDNHTNTYTYIPLNGDNIKCVMSSNIYSPCGLYNNPTTSNTITMRVSTVTNSCPGIPTVSYGGKIYRTVQIGTQCWFKDNLNVGTMIPSTQDQTNNNIIEKYCLNNLESNCDIFGGMYNWSEMVKYQNGATNTKNWSPVPTGNVQGICPDGWHIPTYDEWNVLVTYLGGNAVAGGKLKETSLNHWDAPNRNASNSSLFTGLAGGDRWTNGTFANYRKYVSYWTITGGYDGGVTAMYYGGMSFAIEKSIGGQYYKNNSIGVRCLKN